LTINELSQAGVTGLVDANLSLYKTAIASKGADDVDTTSELQAIIDAVNSTKSADVINTIKGYADNNDASTLTINELSQAGVTGLVTGNLGAYKAAIAAAIPGDVDTPEKLQALINKTNAIEKIKGYANAGNAGGLTLDELSKAGVTGLVEDNLAAYKTAIAAAASGDVDTTEKLQALINKINAIEKIKGYAAIDNANGLTIGELSNAGVSGLIDGNLGAYKTAIAAAKPGDVDTTDKLQAIIDAVNAANPVGSGTSTGGTSTDNNNTSGAGTSTVFYLPPPQPDYFQLSIGSPNGRVYTSPAGIDCNKGQGVCSATFKRGQRISLNIQAPEGVIFAGWSGSNVCSRGSFNIYNSLNCNAIFYGDPNYVKEEVKQPETQPETNPSSNTGSVSNEHPKTYIHSFSVRANIAAKSNCNLTQPQNPNEVAVAGFILRGIGSERVLINARGLEPGVEPKLLLKQTIIQPNGKLEAKDISENANWETHANAQNIPVAYRPKQTIDAALLMDLPAGIYTVTACMNQEAIIDSGVALVSVTPLDNKLSFSNASGRGFVGGGANDVIVGFTVLGTEQRQVQLRGRALGNSEANIIDTALKVGRIYFDPVSNSIKGEEISSIASQRAESVRQTRAAADDSSASVMMDFTPGSYTTVLSSESGKGGLGIVSVDFMD
jgi:uncharacterized protein YerC